jgi:hypothetical protein
MYDPIGDDQLAKLLSLPYFTLSYYEEISNYFQSIIEKCGQEMKVIPLHRGFYRL